MFAPFQNRTVSIEIEYPWIGARRYGREALGELLKKISAQDTEITNIKVALSTDRDNTYDSNTQLNGLKSSIKSAGVSSDVEFDVRNGHRKRFHDRIIRILTKDSGDSAKARYDISSGIDNFMRNNRECTILLEMLN